MNERYFDLIVRKYTFLRFPSRITESVPHAKSSASFCVSVLKNYLDIDQKGVRKILSFVSTYMESLQHF